MIVVVIFLCFLKSTRNVKNTISQEISNNGHIDYDPRVQKTFSISFNEIFSLDSGILID